MGLDRYYQMQYHFFLVSFHMSLVLATAASAASATVPPVLSVHERIVFKFFYFIVDEKIKLKVLACSFEITNKF
jgi:hypothetical protein